MLANERRDYILKKIKNHGAITTAQLVEELGVSIETVRRDLLAMEEGHLLLRVHGGAVAIGEMATPKTLDLRELEYQKEKRALSRRAARLISEGDIIGVDGGSTAVLFAEALRERFESLTVITYSLDVFEILSGIKGITVILAGGCYLPSERCFCGAITVDTISRLRMQKAFVFPTAVSIKQGITYYSDDTALIVSRLFESAEQIFVLADSSKLEKSALISVSEMQREYVYVTDSEVSEEIKRLYAENGYNLIVG